MPKPLNNIHDKFVKEFLSDKEMATSFLRFVLPQSLADEIVLETLTHVNTQYIRADLEEFMSDVVVNIQLKNQQECQVCFLLEHKSYLDKNVPFQVLSYVAEAYLKQIKNKEKLKPIIPLVYYHGTKKWEFKQIDSFFEDFPISIKNHLPLYESIFVSLKAMDESRILSLQNAMLRSALMLQYDANEPEKVLKNIIRILESLDPYLDTNFLITIFVYTLQTTEVKEQQLKIILKELPNKLNDKVMSTYDMILDRGRKEGKLEGKLEGINEGIEKGIEKGKIETVLKAFDNGYKIDDILLFTDFSEIQIIEILKTKNRI